MEEMARKKKLKLLGHGLDRFVGRVAEAYRMDMMVRFLNRSPTATG
jgi:hypothetical protein